MLDIMMCYQRVCRLRPGGTRDASPAAFVVSKLSPKMATPVSFTTGVPSSSV